MDEWWLGNVGRRRPEYREDRPMQRSAPHMSLTALMALLSAGLCLPSGATAPAPPATMWGEARAGLQAGIRMADGRLTIRQGEPLRAELWLRNVTGESIQLDSLAPAAWTVKRQGNRLSLETHPSGAPSFPSNTIILTAREESPANTPPPVFIVREPGWKGDRTDFSVPTVNLEPGTYKLSADNLMALSNQEKDPKGVTTGTVEITVLREPAIANSPALAPFRIAWGEPKDGLQLGSSYVLGRTSYRVGDMVPFTLHARNTGVQPKGFRSWSYPVCDYTPEVTDQAGDRVQVDVVRLTTFIPAQDRSLMPGEATVVAHPWLKLAPPTRVANRDITPSMPAVPGKYRMSHHTIFGLTQGPEGFTNFRTGELAMEITERS